LDTANLWTIHKPRGRWRGGGGDNFGRTGAIADFPLPSGSFPGGENLSESTTARASFLAMGTGAAHRPKGSGRTPLGVCGELVDDPELRPIVARGSQGVPRRRGVSETEPFSRPRSILAAGKKPRTGADRWWLTPRPPSAHRNAWRWCQSVSVSMSISTSKINQCKSQSKGVQAGGLVSPPGNRYLEDRPCL